MSEKAGNEVLENYCSEADYQELLSGLLSEMYTPTSSVQNIALLIKLELAKPERSEELDEFVEMLIKIGNQLYELRNAYFNCAKKKAGQQL